MMEETISVQLNYAELWALLESGTVEPGSAVHAKLSAARAAFERKPKIYGRGLAIRVAKQVSDE